MLGQAVHIGFVADGFFPVLDRIEHVVAELRLQLAQAAADVGKLFFLRRRQGDAGEFEIAQRVFDSRFLRVGIAGKFRLGTQFFKGAVQPLVLAVPRAVFAEFAFGAFVGFAQFVGAGHTVEMVGDAPCVIQFGADVLQGQVEVFPRDFRLPADCFHRFAAFLQQKIHRRHDVFGADGGKIGQFVESEQRVVLQLGGQL